MAAIEQMDVIKKNSNIELDEFRQAAINGFLDKNLNEIKDELDTNRDALAMSLEKTINEQLNIIRDKTIKIGTPIDNQDKKIVDLSTKLLGKENNESIMKKKSEYYDNNKSQKPNTYTPTYKKESTYGDMKFKAKYKQPGEDDEQPGGKDKEKYPKAYNIPQGKIDAELKYGIKKNTTISANLNIKPGKGEISGAGIGVGFKF